MSYSRAEMVAAIREVAGPNLELDNNNVFQADASAREAWLRALESQMPAAGGGPVNARPVQLGRIVEVKVILPRPSPSPARSFAPRLRDYCGLGEGRGWWAPTCINIIELVSESPIPPLQVVGGFDMLQCGVAMLPHGDSGVQFVASEATRECVRRRELRFSRYVLGPLPRLISTHEDDQLTREVGLRRIVSGFMSRALKYTSRGFSVVDLRTDARTPSPQRHPRVRAFEDALDSHPALDRLVLSVFTDHRYPSGRWVLTELCKKLSPVVLRRGIGPGGEPGGGALSTTQPRFACVGHAEIAISLGRLLRHGFLIAQGNEDLHEGDDPRKVDDGFPLLMCTRYHVPTWFGPVGGFGALNATQEQLALTHDYASEVPERHLPAQLVCRLVQGCQDILNSRCTNSLS